MSLLPQPLNLVRLPTKGEAAIAAGAAVVLLLASWAHRGDRIKALEAALGAKPKIEFRDRVVEKRVVLRGPVKIVKVEAPDGTKTTTTERAPETISTDKDRDVARVETPICPQPDRPRTWGFGGSFDLRNKDRGSLGASKSFGDVTVGLAHNVGAAAKIGDVSVNASVKVW